LKSSGASIATSDLLNFQAAHAMARDAVWKQWNTTELSIGPIAEIVGPTLQVTSLVNGRADYLRRPDLGRRLDPQSKKELETYADRRTEDPRTSTDPGFDACFIVSDGLSAKAVESHFIPLWAEIRSVFDPLKLSFAPLVIAPYSRVAISDEIGESLGAKVAIIVIGERPGLSSPDSLGIFTTYAPKVGNTDAHRNCISNIRPPHGLSYVTAAVQLKYLVSESLRRQLSGVDLKALDRSEEKRIHSLVEPTAGDLSDSSLSSSNL